MPTYLQLCQTLHEEVGANGAITSVTGNTGTLLRICNWIAKANRKIQARKIDWNFLWSSWDLTLVENIHEYSPPTLLGSFDESSFWLEAGTTNAKKLKYKSYLEWRDGYRNASLSSADEVDIVTIKPNNKVEVLPIPNSTAAGKVITADYWKAPILLTDNSQVSVIPEQYHSVIVAQAKMYFAEYDGDAGLYSSAYVEHEGLYRQLKAHSLPGKKDELKSEASINDPIIVE